MDKKYVISAIYQFIVLIAVIGLNVMVFTSTGAFNDMLLGALIGVMVGIPAQMIAGNQAPKDKNNL